MMRALIVVIFAAILCGCSTVTKQSAHNLSDTANRNMVETNLAAINAGQIQKLLSSATQNISKGLRVQANGQDVVRMPDGSPYEITVMTEAGPISAPVQSTWSYEASLSSYVDLAGGDVEGLALHVGKIVESLPGNVGMSSIPKRDGLSLIIDKSSGSSTNAEAIKALMTGRAENTTAAGQALAKVIEIDWEGRKGTYVEVVKATGQAVKGVLVALYPASGTGDALKAVIRTADGLVEEALVEAPE